MPDGKSVNMVPFSQLPLSDDFMFGEVMRRAEICKLFLEALLGKPIARIEYITKQQELSESYISHGIRMDVYLRDEGNTVYCVEMQTRMGAALYKRIRYYQGMIDRHNLKKGTHYSELPESFIIIICTADPFGRGLAVYERKVTMVGCEEVDYRDGSHVYLLNSAYQQGNAATAILEFLNCIRTNITDAGTYTTELMKEVCPAIGEVRSDPGKEAEYMTWETKVMDIEYYARQAGREEGRNEGRNEGLKEGLKVGREEGLRALIETLRGFSQDRRSACRIVGERFHLSPEAAEAKVAQYWA